MVRSFGGRGRLSFSVAHRALLVGSAVTLGLAALAPIARAEFTALGDVSPNPIPTDGEADEVIVGNTGSGQLIIDVPTETEPLQSQNGSIGKTVTGTGLVQIFTLGSEWNIDGQLFVGEEGQGTLELVNGGEVNAEDVIVGAELEAQGLINLRGTNSELRSNSLIIGDGGLGQMALTTRARAITAGSAIVGDENSLTTGVGSGFVSVDGLLTRWSVGGNLTIGNLGRGVLSIRNQAEVRATSGVSNIIIGAQANGSGEVLIADQFSRMWSLGTITVGNTNNARGVLRVNDGGEARANAGINIGVDGTLEVSGGTVLTPAINNLGVIQTGVGRVGQIDSVVNNLAVGSNRGEIRAAGTVDRVREKLIFTRQVNNSGLITSIGGEIEFTAGLANTGLIAGRDAIYRFRDLFINDGSLDFTVGTSDVYGRIFNNGTVLAAHNTDVTFYDPFTNNGNLVAFPGGAAMFLSNLILTPPSTVNLQLNATANVEEIGQLQVGGDLQLAGTLNLRTYAGLDPEPGDSFQIITGMNVIGTFDSVLFPPAPGNNWTITYTPNAVILNYVNAPAFNADFNGDGFVNSLDRIIWEQTYGMTVPPPDINGDANGDGVVDGQDYRIWQQSIGPVNAAPVSAAVPEPAAALLLLAAALGLPAMRRK